MPRNRPLAIFFFQAEDGIRDFHVTGVQTCALPISPLLFLVFFVLARQKQKNRPNQSGEGIAALHTRRSEEPRVGKELCPFAPPADPCRWAKTTVRPRW